jgi:hypothetical protein
MASPADAHGREEVSAAPGTPRHTLLGYLAVPRPKDLFKALLAPLTFALAVLATGGTDARTILRAAVVLMALELLVYPARFQWNDVRGFAPDQRHPDEADRERLPGPVERVRRHVTASCVVAVARIALTLVLPFLLPGLQLGGILLWVVAGVFGVAAAYEALRAAGTGREGTVPPPVRPAIVLLWITVGAGYVVRGVTGLALVVDLPRHPALGLAVVVTLWASGTAFVTSRWAIESTAFARLRDGRVEWVAEAGQAREHLLALVRWLPTRADPAATSAKGWAALRPGRSRRGEPARGVLGDVRRHGVRPVELVDFRGNARCLQPRDDPAARPVDRQHRVGAAVREIDVRRARPGCRDQEAGGERDDVGEEVGVGEPERQRVGGAVGETADRQPGGVHRVGGEDVGERLVDSSHVAVPPTLGDHIPGAVPRAGGNQQESMGVGVWEQGSEPAPCVAARTVTGEHQASRTGSVVRRSRDTHEHLRPGPEIERVHAGCRRGGCRS